MGITAKIITKLYMSLHGLYIICCFLGLLFSKTALFTFHCGQCCLFVFIPYDGSELLIIFGEKSPCYLSVLSDYLEWVWCCYLFRLFAIYLFHEILCVAPFVCRVWRTMDIDEHLSTSVQAASG